MKMEVVALLLTIQKVWRTIDYVNWFFGFDIVFCVKNGGGELQNISLIWGNTLNCASSQYLLALANLFHGKNVGACILESND